MKKTETEDKNKLVSIIVPVYNSEKYLTKCLDSIISQTYQNIEVILINDGSTDGSSEICDKYANHDTRISVLHTKNAGVSSARNSGIETASGNFLAFVDSDDWIDKEFIKNMVKAIIREASEYVICGRNLYINGEITEGVPILKAIPSISDNRNRRDNLIKHFAGHFLYGSVYAKLFISEIVTSYRIRFNTALLKNEDVIFNMMYLSHISRISVIESCGYFYRQHPDSLTASYEKNAFERIILTSDEKINIAKRLNIDRFDFNRIIHKWKINEMIKSFRHCFFDYSYVDFRKRKQRLAKVKAGLKKIWHEDLNLRNDLKLKTRLFINLFLKIGFFRYFLLVISHYQSAALKRRDKRG